MFKAGWVANHDGNLSARITEDRIVCSPTAFSKVEVTLDDLVVLNLAGEHIAGRRRPFSEMGLHRKIYTARPEVRAVVHAHPPFATAFGVSRPLPHPFLPEAVISLGAEIPTVPLKIPGATAEEALLPFIKRCDALLISGNGVLSWGPDPETAYLRMELVEHIAQIAHLALPLGGPELLPEEMVWRLLRKRGQAGLSAPEEPTAALPQLPEVQKATQKALAGLPHIDQSLARRLAEEIAKKSLTQGGR